MVLTEDEARARRLAYKRAYRLRPEVKQRRAEYMREYRERSRTSATAREALRKRRRAYKLRRKQRDPEGWRERRRREKRAARRRKRLARQQAGRAASPGSSRVESGAVLERYSLKLLAALGHQVEHTGRPGDHGLDIVVNRHVMVQCRNSKKPVGARVIREVIGARLIANKESAIVICPAGFTPAARELADLYSVSVWDAQHLRMLAKRAAVVCWEEGLDPVLGRGRCSEERLV